MLFMQFSFHPFIKTAAYAFAYAVKVLPQRCGLAYILKADVYC